VLRVRGNALRARGAAPAANAAARSEAGVKRRRFTPCAQNFRAVAS